MSIASTSNPFSTRFTRPGAIDFRCRETESLDQIVATLQASRWQGQIVGPHGSGKSTLLHALMPQLERHGKRIQRTTLSSGERSIDYATLNPSRWNSQTLVIIDGYEQLSCFSRWRLQSRVKRSGSGLLVTTHRPVRLPLIYETNTSVALLASLVATLAPTQVIASATIERCYHQHGGNLREALFALYDQCEAS